jgi:hypothetical protein
VTRGSLETGPWYAGTRTAVTGRAKGRGPLARHWTRWPEYAVGQRRGKGPASQAGVLTAREPLRANSRLTACEPRGTDRMVRNSLACAIGVLTQSDSACWGTDGA